MQGTDSRIDRQLFICWQGKLGKDGAGAKGRASLTATCRTVTDVQSERLRRGRLKRHRAALAGDVHDGKYAGDSLLRLAKRKGEAPRDARGCWDTCKNLLKVSKRVVGSAPESFRHALGGEVCRYTTRKDSILSISVLVLIRVVRCRTWGRARKCAR